MPIKYRWHLDTSIVIPLLIPKYVSKDQRIVINKFFHGTLCKAPDTEITISSFAMAEAIANIYHKFLKLIDKKEVKYFLSDRLYEIYNKLGHRLKPAYTTNNIPQLLETTNEIMKIDKTLDTYDSIIIATAIHDPKAQKLFFFGETKLFKSTHTLRKITQYIKKQREKQGYKTKLNLHQI